MIEVSCGQINFTFACATDISGMSVSSQLPVLSSLREYHHLPGSIVMLEASLRGRHKCTTADQLHTAICSISSTLNLLYGSQQQATLPACISLAATLHKLMVVYLHKTAAARDQDLHLHGHKVWVWSEARATGASSAPAACAAIYNSSNVDGQLHSIMYRQQRLIIALEAHKLLTSVQHLGANSASHSNDKPSSSNPPARVHQLHQLQSVLLMGMVQICHERLLHARQPQPRWYKALLLSLGALSSNLTEVMTVLLPNAKILMNITEPRSQRVWEWYAVSHFHGRLVPGCCYLGCTNLSGVSEAGLKTQLCSGCGRTRYCSVECQKAAWLHGDHKILCRG